jgi:hypothetical protein
VFTRENTRSLGMIATACGYLKADDADLWKLILQKLSDENMHKYVTLRDTVHLLDALSTHGAISQHPIIQTLHNTIVKQKAYYENYPELL